MASMEQNGIIIKGVGGLYEVKTDTEIHYCSARGKFRKREISPLPGDHVRIELIPQSGAQKKDVMEADAVIAQILPRKNEFIRPKLANLTHLFLVSSAISPVPSMIVLDKLCAVCVHKGVAPVFIFTKSDLAGTESYASVYRHAGFPVFVVSNETGEGVSEVTAYLREITSMKECCIAFAGNSGVGKSSLLNRIFPELNLTTGEISQKLGRGRHTTRTAQLYPVWDTQSCIADTPGFGAMETGRYELIRKEELADCFPEFIPYLGDCRFIGCSHTVEKGCAVLVSLAKRGKLRKPVTRAIVRCMRKQRESRNGN